MIRRLLYEILTAINSPNEDQHFPSQAANALTDRPFFFRLNPDMFSR